MHVESLILTRALLVAVAEQVLAECDALTDSLCELDVDTDLLKVEPGVAVPAVLSLKNLIAADRIEKRWTRYSNFCRS